MGSSWLKSCFKESFLSKYFASLLRDVRHNSPRSILCHSLCNCCSNDLCGTNYCSSSDLRGTNYCANICCTSGQCAFGWLHLCKLASDDDGSSNDLCGTNYCCASLYSTYFLCGTNYCSNV